MFDNILVPENEHHPENHTSSTQHPAFTHSSLVRAVRYYVSFFDCMLGNSWNMENAVIFHLITSVRHNIVCLHGGNDIPRMNEFIVLLVQGKHKCNAIATLYEFSAVFAHKKQQKKATTNNFDFINCARVFSACLLRIATSDV